MPAPIGNFGPVNGTPTEPQFARLAILGHTVEANTTHKPMVTTCDFRAPLTSPGGLLTTLATNLQTALGTTYRGLCTDDYVLDFWAVKYLDDPLSPIYAMPDGATGAVSTDRSASFTAGVFRKVTGVPSRNYRGSMHVGAMPESYTTKDDLSSAGVAAYAAHQAALEALVSGGVVDGSSQFFPVVISSTLSTLTASPAVLWGAWIQTFPYNARLGTMKRRKERS